jgi:hypothetical protein
MAPDWMHDDWPHAVVMYTIQCSGDAAHCPIATCLAGAAGRGWQASRTA